MLLLVSALWSRLKNPYWIFRSVYHVVSIVSIVFTLVSLLYSGFFEHRAWLNERIADSYASVEEMQGIVLKEILEKVPSIANGDSQLSAEDMLDLRLTLADLSIVVSRVDAPSGEVADASRVYRERIAGLSNAVINYNPLRPESHADLVLAVDRFDVAAQNFANVVENRIGSFRKSLLPSS